MDQLITIGTIVPDVENASQDESHCPKCGEKFETIQRITGYLVGTTDRWNSGKLAELHDRVVHE